MPTIIDSLIVKLGLDPTAFKKGSADSKKELKSLGDEGRRQAIEETKRATQREKQAKTAAESIHKIKNQVLGMAAAMVSASGIMAFTVNLTKSDAAVGRLSTNLGMGVKSLTSWQGAAEKLGSTGGDVESMFRRINQIIQERKTTGGSSAFNPMAKMDGNIIAKFLDDSTTMEQRAIMLGEAMKKVSAQDAQTYGVAAGFDEGTINFLRHSTEEINAMVEAQKKLSFTTDADKDAAQQRATAWSAFSNSLTQVGRTIETFLTPAIVKVLEVLKGMPEAVLAIGALSTIAAGLTALRFAGTIAGIGGISGALGAASTAASGLMAVLMRLALPAAALWGTYQIYRLGSAVKDLWDINHREGVTLTPDAQARITGRSQSGSVTGSLGSGSASSASPSVSPKALFSALEKKWGLPAGLLDSVWKQESSRGKNKGPSRTGALGDFQFMPDTAKAYGLADRSDFVQSATAAAHMLGDLSKQYGGDLNKMLAGYNYGSGNLQRSGMGKLPAETRNYIASIRSNMRGSAGGGNSSSTDVKVGQVTIHTQATDAKGIAIDFGNAVSQHAFATQANAGVR